MKAITLRNIPPKVARELERRARKRRTSLNRVVLEILEEVTAAPARGPDGLFDERDGVRGSITAEEAEEMIRVSKDLRKIDPEMWK